MIRIYKDTDIKVVTQGAYDTFYKSLGYNVIIDEPKSIVEPKNIVEPKVGNDILGETKDKETVANIKKGRINKKNKKED